jgi:prepilin-type N-terminal cleavage/methylation domain-containing protein
VQRDSGPKRLRRLRGKQGSTLIEVLVAMVILAVGLLALESLAIGAVQQVASANRTSQYTLIASENLERALETGRRAPTTIQAQQGQQVLPNGTQVVTLVTPQAIGGGTVWRIDVTVTPPSTVKNVQPVTLRGSFFQ